MKDLQLRRLIEPEGFDLSGQRIRAAFFTNYTEDSLTYLYEQRAGNWYFALVFVMSAALSSTVASDCLSTFFKVMYRRAQALVFTFLSVNCLASSPSVNVSAIGPVNLAVSVADPSDVSGSVLSVSPPFSSTGILHGNVLDSNGAAVFDAEIVALNTETGISRSGKTDSAGFYQFAAMPVGAYAITVRRQGFQTQTVHSVNVEIGRTIVLDFKLGIGTLSEQVDVPSDSPLVDLTGVSVGQVINQRTVQEIPLNGRYFVDLGLLVPGSVTPPQNGFLSPPTRGGGSLALNTAGNREDTINFQINGITLNDQVNNILNFNPPLASIREFKIDNSTFSAEYGRNSGSVINVATRSGTRDFHGELYEFFRNNALDARNFFNFTSDEPPPFKRNQFGGALGGPVILPRFGEGGPALWNGKNSTFFFFTYESLQQRQGVDLNTLVLSDAQRASVTDPIIRRLIQLIPLPNFIDSSGSPRFVGSAKASADTKQWTIDISHIISANDLLHAYYAYHNSVRNEPTLQGTTLPGFGDVRLGVRQILTFNETHIFGPNLVNEARFGFNRISFTGKAAAEFNPAEFGINIGVDQPIGLPQINIPGGFNFGGPARLPQGRKDTTFVFSDTVNYLRGRHSLKLGGEFRLFYNHNFLLDTGSVNFPSVPAFLAGNANSFLITLGELTNIIKQPSVGVFVQDVFRVLPNLTLDLGFRYDLNFVPTERDDRFIVFDPQTVSLLRVGRDIDQPFRSNYKNFQPRLGFAWDPFGNGRTSLRTAYAIMVEQPMTNAVANTSVNPPLATPLSFTGAIRLDNAINIATAAGLAPISVDYNYKNSNIRSWNLNVQHEVLPDLAVMIGYFGSKGTHLRISRNINQPVNGVRPFPRLSVSSPELPGTLLGNIVQVESSGNSSYSALWATLTKRFSEGLQFNAYYTFSKSIDYNSLSSPPQLVTVQDSHDIRNDRGLSDFDARHRFVLCAIYELPFEGNRLKEGWQIGIIAQGQSGNPANIVTGNSSINGVANTIRPDVNSPVDNIGSVDRWFDTSAFVPAARFGNLGRNVIIGPAFYNVDFSVVKNTRLSDSLRVQLRAEFFDILNNANFGQPGRIVGSPAFGRITNTRFPTGDSGSSRQLQFAVKLVF